MFIIYYGQTIIKIINKYFTILIGVKNKPNSVRYILINLMKFIIV